MFALLSLLTALAADVDLDGFEPPEDCDDTRADVHPGGAERVADGVDGDCDGAELCWPDGDADGFGDSAAVVAGALDCGGDATVAGDCDDTDDRVNPGATERCDTLDNDCDGGVDNATGPDMVTWYRDADGDAWGDVTAPSTSCAVPDGYTARAGDCDDADATRSPGAVELCDGADNDCDEATGDPNGGASDWVQDADGDGFGDPATATSACEAPGEDWIAAGLPDPDDADATCSYGYPCTGCGCASAPSSSWIGWMGLAALARRRASRAAAR